MTTSDNTRKSFKEDFAKFYEDPTREGLRDLLKNNLGEFPYLDFKGELPSFGKLARHLLGIANLGGGCIVVGVAERDDKTLESKGLNKIVDKKNIIDGIKKFLPYVLLQNIDIADFVYDATEYEAIKGKKFQVIFVSGDPKHFPFVSMSEGDGIRKNAIYARHGTSSEEANYEELQSIINRRIETSYSSQGEIDLRTHIEELKSLYSYIEKGYVVSKKEASNLLKLYMPSLKELKDLEYVRNPNYPEEDVEKFIAKLIEKKKKRIEIIIDVINL
jgi:hypothetical protein